MEQVNDLLAAVIQVLWGVPTFITLLAVGIVFSLWTKFVQFRSLTHGVALVRGRYDDAADPGAINHFQALSTALSGTVGLGNIGGVALAIGIGGPGALFWMWMTGFFGMAIKAVEVTLTMLYRDTSEPDNPHGGAMWVAVRGIGQRWGGAARPLSYALAAVFCITLLVATITSGNMFQSWNVANITHAYFGVPQVFSGLVMATLTALVILGGIKRIGDVAGTLVPVMCGLYLVAGCVVLVVEAANVPRLLASVVEGAFRPTEAQGAFLGAGVWLALTTGLRRALFSNEAGQGTSPIAHSAAKTDEPAREGIVAGLEPFVDTCLVCTLTALVILATNTWNREPIGQFRESVRFAPTGGRHMNVPANDEPTRSDSAWHVVDSTDAANLPELADGEHWSVGQRFFLLADVSTPGEPGLSKRTRVVGSLVAGDASPHELQIEWGPVAAGSRLVNRDVYRDFTGATLTGHAFDRAIPGLGKWLVTLTCWLFAVSTMISWSYYGEQAIVFLAGSWAVAAYKIVFCALGIVATLPNFIRTDEHLANLADLGSGCMLLSNAPIIVLLAYQAVATLADYLRRLDAGQLEQPHRARPLAEVMEGRDVE